MILECYNLLKAIEKRPAMFIGEATLKNIKIFISGYHVALVENKIATESQVEPFFDWTARKLGYYESTAGWANMILASSLGINPETVIWEHVFALQITQEQHLDSINLFYELLEEYKNEILQENNLP
ncbi:hypothetical protein [Flavobacterium hungaricum]|uniref:Uncharacterized protein n=1 Tax=Flavobacterium hungaricum TaxID=2082725 RepID=A0ABR9THI0_9FLAO|nr:hypothetical protein [Flavobacterium hungaricum]MBE8724720.1 hypothetical protein [Flavobacterium hungaricum]